MDRQSPNGSSASNEEWEAWMQFIDWETLDWIPDAPASVMQDR
jgi:hypothetical protein